jgi:hypothetical protein
MNTRLGGVSARDPFATTAIKAATATARIPADQWGWMQ